MPTCPRAGAPVLGRPLEQDHLRAGARRLKRRARAGDPEADHHDVGLVAPLRDVVRLDRGGQLGAHGCGVYAAN